MIDPTTLPDYKEKPRELAVALSPADVDQLITFMLTEQTSVRYTAYLVLQERACLCDDLYHYWDIFCRELEHPNAFRRDCAVAMLAVNVRWDTDNRFDAIFPRYLAMLQDSSFIVCRGVISSLKSWMEFRPDLAAQAVNQLTEVDLFACRHPSLILRDILGVLIPYQKLTGDEYTTEYILQAFTGGLLQKKQVKALQELWENQAP